MEEIGRNNTKIDCANDVAPSKEKQAPPQGGICFSWGANERAVCEADNKARKARARESYVAADITLWDAKAEHQILQSRGPVSLTSRLI